MGHELHPDKFENYVRNEAVLTGLNHDPTNDEAYWIRCKKCGHVMNTKRRPKGFGSGVNLTRQIVTITLS